MMYQADCVPVLGFSMDPGRSVLQLEQPQMPLFVFPVLEGRWLERCGDVDWTFEISFMEAQADIGW